MTAPPDLPGVLSADELHATATHLSSLQLESGMIPWFPGGPPSPYMTLYILQGFSRALAKEIMSNGQ